MSSALLPEVPLGQTHAPRRARKRENNQARSKVDFCFQSECFLFLAPRFRCLDEEYLTVKCFLLERFLHDVLNETNDPGLVFSFIGA